MFNTTNRQLKNLVRENIMPAMKRYALVMLAWSVCVVLTGCKRAVNTPQSVAKVDPVHGHLLHALPKLPTVKLRLGEHELVAEIARKPVEIATGMMFRTNLNENEGMLFVFSAPGPKNFYGRNCLIPLSVAFIAPDGTLLQTTDLQPGDEKGVRSWSSNVQFVLEVRQGWFDRHGIRPGAVVITEKGTLLRTFFGQ